MPGVSVPWRDISVHPYYRTSFHFCLDLLGTIFWLVRSFRLLCMTASLHIFNTGQPNVFHYKQSKIVESSCFWNKVLSLEIDNSFAFLQSIIRGLVMSLFFRPLNLYYNIYLLLVMFWSNPEKLFDFSLLSFVFGSGGRLVYRFSVLLF